MAQFNNNLNFEYEEDEIDLKELFKTLKKRKWFIFNFTLISVLIALIYLFYTPKTYQSKATIEVSSSGGSSFSAGQLMSLVGLGGGGGSDVDSEIAVIKSRPLIKKTINKLSLDKEYIGVNNFYKKIYYYKDSPIEIVFNKAVNQELLFKIIPNNSNYILEIKNIYTDKTDKIKGSFNKEIKYKDLVFTIKKRLEFDDIKYFIFKKHQSDYFADIIKKENLSVQTVPKSKNLIEISYKDYEANKSKDFVDSLTALYLKYNIGKKTKKYSFTIKIANEQLQKIEKSLKESSKKLQKFKEKNKAIDVQEDLKLLSNKYADFESSKNLLNLQIETIQNILNSIKKNKNIQTLTLAGVGINDVNLANSINELQKAIINKEELLKNYTPAHPDVQKISVRIRNLKEIILNSIKNILKNLNERKAFLDKELNKLNQKIAKLPAQEQEYIKLNRDFTVNSKFYSYLMQKKLEAEIQKASIQEKNKVLEKALLPLKPISPKSKLILVVAAVTALILAIFIVFFLEFLKNKITSAHELKAYAKKVYEISHFKKVKDYFLDKSSLKEFKNIASNLLFFDKNIKLIAIGSTIKKEGKTFVAVNLAKALSEYNKKVLILDCNFSEPKIKDIFKLNSNKDFLDYLNKKVNLEEIFYKSEIKNIFIAPLNKKIENSSIIVSSYEFKGFLEELKNSFDYIIIDTEAINENIDSKFILNISEKILYLFRANFSEIDFTKELEEIEELKVEIILNDIKKGS